MSDIAEPKQEGALFYLFAISKYITNNNCDSSILQKDTDKDTDTEGKEGQ